MKFALSQLWKSPGFTGVAVLSLALGIGANTAVFSLVNAVMLRLLPVKAPGELVLFNWLAESGASPHSSSGWSTRDPASGKQTSTSFSIHTFEEFRDHNDTLSSVFAFAPSYGGVTVNVDGQADIARNAQWASGQYHLGLGVTAAAGRLFTPADDEPAAPGVVVISHRYWQRRFGTDPAAIGKSILVNNTPVTIIGVTAPHFAGTMQVGEFIDVTLPLALEPRMNTRPEEGRKPDYWWVRIMGRLKPGVSAAQAQANLEGVFQETARGNLSTPRKSAAAAEKAAASPGEPDPRGMRLRAESGAQGLVEARREQQKSLRLLLGLVALVLLVACANVANLLLARGAARRREIAVRLSLGASRARIVGQLLAESLLLALLGAAVGVVFAIWGRNTLLALQPLGSGPTELDATLDLRVLAFTSAIAVLTGVLFGLVPALRATRVNLSAEFQGGTRALGTGSRSLLAKSLMTIQVALSLVLLIGAGLFVRTLRNLEQADVGFNREHLLLFQINAIANGTPQAQTLALYDRVAARLASMPGVRSTGFSRIQLLSGGSWSTGINVPGGESGVTNVNARANDIDPGFFSTIGLPLLFGRNFTARDEAGAPKVAIVNQALALKCFGTENVVGRRIGFGSRDPNTEIVGVVRDAQYFNVKSAPPPTIYGPYAQGGRPGVGQFVVRLAAEPAAVVPAIRAAIKEIDPTVPLFDVRTQEEQINRLFTQERLFASLCSAFGVLALLLAAVGLYGLMSYAVLRRTGEIGLRMALGALPAGVLWMIVRESLALVSIGIAIGLAAAFGATRAIASMLFGLSASDPLTYAAVAVLMVIVAIVACLMPARRASKVDPMVALRTE